MNDTRYKYVACVRRNTAKLGCTPVCEDFWFIFKSCIAPHGDFQGVRDGEFHHILLSDLWNKFHRVNVLPVGGSEWGDQLPILVQVTALGYWEASPIVACRHCGQEIPRDDAVTYKPGYDTPLHFCGGNCRDNWRGEHEQNLSMTAAHVVPDTAIKAVPPETLDDEF